MIVIHVPNKHHIVLWGLANHLSGKGYAATVSWEGTGSITTEAPRDVVDEVLKAWLEHLPSAGELYRVEEV